MAGQTRRRSCPPWGLQGSAADVTVIDRAQAEGVAPRASEVSAVMRACIRLGHVGTALKLFDQMLAKGAAPDAHLIRKPISDKFFKLVADNLDVKRIQEDGLRLLDLVQAHGLAPSITTQNCLIIAWKSKLPESVVKYFLDMKSAGVHISRLAYQSILMAHERSDPEFALKIYDEMEMLGIKTDRVGYNAMLGACLQLGMHDEARQLLMQMAERTLVPDAKSYSVMLASRRTVTPLSNVPRLAPLLDRWEGIVSVC
jgi:pentatricopeptide repeat protein